MKTKATAPDGRRVDRALLAVVGNEFGLTVLDDTGVARGRALAARLLGDSVASTETFLDIQRATGALLLGFFEADELTGLLAGFPLNDAGHAQVRAGVFDAIEVDPSLVCWGDEVPAAYYAWGFVASTKEAARAVVKGTAALHAKLLWATPTYARAVTAEGHRALTSLGFQAYLADEPNLLCLDARPPQAGRAL